MKKHGRGSDHKGQSASIGYDAGFHGRRYAQDLYGAYGPSSDSHPFSIPSGLDTHDTYNSSRSHPPLPLQPRSSGLLPNQATRYGTSQGRDRRDRRLVEDRHHQNSYGPSPDIQSVSLDRSSSYNHGHSARPRDVPGGITGKAPSLQGPVRQQPAVAQGPMISNQAYLGSHISNLNEPDQRSSIRMPQIAHGRDKPEVKRESVLSSLDLDRPVTANDVSRFTSVELPMSEVEYGKFGVFKLQSQLLRLNSKATEAVIRQNHSNTGPRQESNSFLSALSSLTSPGKSKKASLKHSVPSDFPHPQDLYYSSCIIASPLLRKQLNAKMVDCKLAVILLAPLDGKLRLFLHGMQGIILPAISQSLHSVNAADHKLPIVSFLKLGNGLQISKSKLINGLINRETNIQHDTFFHRECALGDQHRVESEGVVEAAWLLPNKSSGRFRVETMLLNLRGNAYLHLDQARFLGLVSSLVVIVMSTDELVYVKFKQIYDELRRSDNRKCILFLLPGQYDPSEVFRKCQSMFGQSGPHNSETLLTFSNEGSCTLLNTTQLTNTVTESITNCLNSSRDTISLAHVTECKDNLNLMNIQVDSDIDDALVFAREASERLIKDFPDDVQKDTLLPLQKHWQDFIKWSKVDAQQQSVCPTDEKLDVDADGDNKDKGGPINCMRTSRQNQLEKLASSSFMEKFLTESVGCYRSRLPGATCTFFDNIKTFLDQRSRSVLPLWDKNYQNLRSELSRDQRDRESVITELASAEQELEELSLDIYHFFREMAQIYEVLSEQSVHRHEMPSIFSEYLTFPAIAALILMSGLPLEIMDGDAGGIPICWIKAVFEEVRLKLMNKRVLVVGVLGVQSSGKSSLLNSMFGVDFAVSAGRCTKGVYSQLLPVQKEGGRDIAFDYVLLLDTEGIRAWEHTDCSVKRDNEIAAFVIGMSDITIMNVQGEQYADIKDVLQIFVHAYMRMFLQKMNRFCIFVHQNVSAPDASHKLRTMREALVRALDQATQNAAEIEGFDHIFKSFAQIMSFNDGKHSFYFPNIYLGDRPMAPTSPAYYEKVSQVRTLLFDMFKDFKGLKQMSEIKFLLETLWKGIMSEEYVFRFRNADEIIAYTGFEAKVQEAYLQVDAFLKHNCYMQAISEFNNCLQVNMLDSVYGSVCSVLESKINQKICELSVSISKIVTANPSVSKYRRGLVQGMPLEAERIAVCGRLQQMLLSLRERRYNQLMLNSSAATKDQQHLLMDEVYLISEQLYERGGLIDDKALESKFDQIWSEHADHTICPEIIDITCSVEDVLRNFYQGNAKALSNELMDHPLSDERGSLMIPFTPAELQTSSDGKFVCPNTSYKQRLFHQFRTNKNPQVRIQEIIKAINKMISDIDKQPRYLPANVFNILKRISEEFDRLGKKDTPYKFTPACERVFAINVLRVCLPKLRHIEAKFEDNYGYKTKLEERRRKLLKIFRMNVRKTEIEDGLPKAMFSMIKGALIDFLRHKVLGEIAHESRKCFQGKQDFSNQFHHRFIDGTLSFEAYMEFLVEPRDACFQYYINWLQQEFFSSSYETNCQVASIADEYLDDLMAILTKCIEQTKCRVEGDLTSRTCTMKDWMDNLIGLLNESNIPVDNTIHAHFRSSMRIKDVRAFTDRSVIHISDFSKILYKHFEQGTIESILQDDEMEQDLFRILWGCDSKCPTCGEPCGSVLINHDPSPHHCQEHRSTGVLGFVLSDGERLSGSNCSMQKFLDDSRNKREVRKYRTSSLHVMENWDLPLGSSTRLLSPYWRWFLANHATELATYYCKQEPEISVKWRSVTRQAAKNHLLTVYSPAYNQLGQTRLN